MKRPQATHKNLSAEIETMCSSQVIIRGVWFEFLQNKGALEPIKDEIKEILWAGLESIITERGFVFPLSAVSKLHFHDSFFAAARVSGSQHNAVCSGRCLGWECPWLVPLDGCQGAVANINRRKKGYFSPSLSLCQTWIAFHGTQKIICLCPLGLFPW